MSVTLEELAAALGGTCSGHKGLELRSVAPIDSAGAGDVTFLANRKYDRFLATTAASAIILDEKTPFAREDVATIRVKDSYIGFALALRLFHPYETPAATDVHPSAIVDPDAVLGENVSIGAGAVVEAGARVGDRSRIHAGAVLTAGSSVGRDCIVYPNVSILAGARIGDRVIIHAGTTIGSDGFGFAPSGEEWLKVPQIGSVLIGDDVEIGANCAIDRGALGDTVIKRGCKIDNLIQIAHNVLIGEDTVIAAQSGVSGSTIVGRHVLIAGQVGLVGHIEIADNVTIGAQSGVSKSLLEAGKTFRGSPAHEIHEALRQEAAMRRLPELLSSVRALETKLAALETELLAHERVSRNGTDAA